MARTRGLITTEPEWTKKMSDREIVENFKKHLDSQRTGYEALGRQVAHLGPRLYKVLIDGLMFQQAKDKGNNRAKS